MQKLVLDAELRTRLGGGAAKVTLTDKAGKAIGHYLPDDLYRQIVDLLIPQEQDSRLAGIEDLRRGNVVATPELLSGLQSKLARWGGKP